MGLLLYDADCGFCTQVARRLPWLRLGVEIRSIQETDLAAYDVSAERALRELPYVGSDGAVSYGHRAVAEALGTGPAPVRLVGRVVGWRLLAPVFARLYRWVSEHRHRLPGGTATCSLDATR